MPALLLLCGEQRMLKTCPTCGKIVDAHHVCPRARDSRSKYYKEYHQSHENRRFRSSKSWQRKRAEIRERDIGLDQAALHGLDPDHPEPYINTENLSVHHIVPLDADRSLALDDYNLITLGQHTHELAEAGKIPAEALKRIAAENTEKRGV